MSKRVIIVHGWGGSPRSNWIPWLKSELENRGYEAIVPAMPDTERPRIESWVGHLGEIAGETDENTYFVSHSIGCQTILRYLENLPAGAKAGGAVFVAGWLTLHGLEEEEGAAEVAAPWLETPIDFAKVREHCPKITAIFSDNDYYVPLEDKERFEKNLEARTLVEKNMGHFNTDDGVYELPVVLKEILAISV